MSEDGLMTCFVESYDDASGNSTSEEETANNWGNLTDLATIETNVTEEEEAYEKVSRTFVLRRKLTVPRVTIKHLQTVFRRKKSFSHTPLYSYCMYM